MLNSYVADKQPVLNFGLKGCFVHKLIKQFTFLCQLQNGILF